MTKKNNKEDKWAEYKTEYKIKKIPATYKICENDMGDIVARFSHGDAPALVAEEELYKKLKYVKYLVSKENIERFVETNFDKDKEHTKKIIEKFAEEIEKEILDEFKIAE